MNCKLFSTGSEIDPKTVAVPYRQFLSYLIVGVVNTILSYSIYAAFLSIGVEYKLANLGALVISIFTGFKLQGTFVFGNKSNRLIFRYVVLWTTLYFLNIAMIGLLKDYGFNYYLAGAIALAPIVGISFLLQKYVVFRRHS